MKFFKKIALILSLLIVFMVPGLSHGQEKNQVLIRINGRTLELGIDPILLDGTVYVPMRGVLESLGIRVSWNQDTRTASALKDGRELEISTADNKLKVDGEFVPIARASILRDNTSFIPLRLVAEVFGNRVVWAPSKAGGGTVSIYSDLEKGRIINSSRALSCFMTKDELIEIMGQPKRVDLAYGQGSWYIYNNDESSYGDYIQLKLYNDIVTEIETNSKNWVLDGELRNGDEYSQVKSNFWKSNLKNTGIDAEFQSGPKGEITSIRLYIHHIWKETIDENKDLLSLESGFEARVFDLTNSLRVGRGLRPFVRSGELDGVAKFHSEEMNEKEYFSHSDYRGNDFSYRFRGMGLSKVAENIGMGQPKASQIVNDWFNSKGHRENMMGDFEYLGLGVSINRENKRIYYTQNFASK